MAPNIFFFFFKKKKKKKKLVSQVHIHSSLVKYYFTNLLFSNHFLLLYSNKNIESLLEYWYSHIGKNLQIVEKSWNGQLLYYYSQDSNSETFM